eukprot:TRINITY_DN2486_c1_g3_i1.p1 TRINITY_DN2486_c1_g3~~TRINITY_DN2486_c1_g3_i1.p1  ORF type:complete len:386 (+),score=71.79 TRINITY_DN2486_c1_g3_i1:123-1280(+)
MSFVVKACADINGQKINLEIPFASQPTIPELMQRITEFYDYESKAMRSPRAFQISRIQIHNDSLLKWDELTRMDQLRPGSQLYCHQPNVTDIQADLPDAVRAQHPMASGGAGGSLGYPGYHASPVPIRTGTTALGEREHVDTETKLQCVFQELDTSKKGFLEYGDLERGFKQRGLHFAVRTIGELFHKADVNRDSRIYFDEWVTWGSVYPNTLDAMYYRGRDTDEEGGIRRAQRELQDMNDADMLAAELLNEMIKRSVNPAQLGNCVKSLNRYLGPAAQALHADPGRDVRPDIQRALEDLSRDVSQREKQMPELEAQLRAAAERRNLLQQQEMTLLEQEIRLERTRDQMRLQEAKYAEAEHLFNTKAGETGSPRRARRVINPSVQ